MGVLIGIVLCLMIFVVAALVYTWQYTFASPRGNQNDDHNVIRSAQMDVFREDIIAAVDRVNALPWEDVSVRSHDGLKLMGRYLHQKDGAPLAICFHGYRGTPSRDFSGGTFLYIDAGYNILMIEERAHKRSEGHAISFGVLERRDCMRWIEYAVQRFGSDVRICLCGISMGAATVLMAIDQGLPKQVKGIVADCPYSSPKEIIWKVSASKYFMPAVSWMMVTFVAKFVGHFDLEESAAFRSVPQAEVPILLIHGEEDHFVPCWMSRKIYEAAPDKIEFHTFPGAGHGLSYLVDKERYCRIVNAFLAKILE